MYTSNNNNNNNNNNNKNNNSVFTYLCFIVQGGSNMTGTSAACLHTNQSRSYLNHLVFYCLMTA
jgi:hypothetical protein